MFNEGDFEGRAKRGELTVEVVASHPAPLGLKMPPGTLSQIVAYRDLQGVELASAHRYLKPDGTLGFSEMPDPKSVMKNGVLYTAWFGSRLGDLLQAKPTSPG